LLTDKPTPDKNKKCRIFISIAEPIVIVLCAGLITALLKSGYGYDIEFISVGGPEMAEAGCLNLQIGNSYNFIPLLSRN